MRLKAVAFTLACALVSTSAIAKDIASTSLCGDAYVLAMAPDRVSALSWQSRDSLSRAPDDMQALPQAWDDIERLIALSPDLVVFGGGEGSAHSDIFAKTGIKSVSANWGEDFDTVRSNYQDIAKGLGVSSKPHIEDLDDRLASLQARSNKRGTTPSIFYMARSGGTGGSGTFIDAAIQAAGGINVMTTPGWTNVDIETALTLEPDLIITSYFTDGYESIQATGIRNKVLSNFITAHPNVDIPGALWPCAGPGLIEAAERIADALDALP